MPPPGIPARVPSPFPIRFAALLMAVLKSLLPLIALPGLLAGCSACRSPRPGPAAALLEARRVASPQSSPCLALPDAWPEDDSAACPASGDKPIVQRLPPCPVPFPERLRQEGANLWVDHRNYYSCAAMRELAAALGLAAVLANTPLDQQFQDWYQQDVRCDGLDRLSGFVKPFGDGRYAVPACVGLGVLGAIRDETRWGSGLAEFGGRSGRAFAVGAPTLLLFQYGIGSSRPGQSAAGSHWRPFQDVHGAAGHAFIGAVPFLTAARMSDDRLLRACLYLCSTLPTWSRLNDDMHYLSQSVLGWWVASMACDAVDQTQLSAGAVQFAPVATPEMVGLGVIFSH